ncbi:hypothetical protein ElyMa_006896900 [Elysia marginata]|uniref:Uncharacterized protein n=1 Tax=Elysia marginata TaxID=1093978 RepID=A0AAV4JDA8_9GAST|nr:hypothetical protein ElyMa_006896900 [Elysia marginata]
METLTLLLEGDEEMLKGAQEKTQPRVMLKCPTEQVSKSARINKGHNSSTHIFSDSNFLSSYVAIPIQKNEAIPTDLSIFRINAITKQHSA